MDVEITKKIAHLKDRTLHLCLYGWSLSHIRRIDVLPPSKEPRAQQQAVGRTPPWLALHMRAEQHQACRRALVKGETRGKERD